MNRFNTIEEFAANESFQDYVLEKSSKAVEDWQSYIIENPEKLREIEAASNIVKKFSPTPVVALKKELKFSTSNNTTKSFILKFIIVGFLIGVSYFLYKNLVYKSPEIITTIVAENQTKQLTLDDGSTVILKPNSSISYSNENNRQVDLDGSAHFNIITNKSKPFKVSADFGEVKVLGTIFTINQSDDQSNFLVLHEGQVLFTDTEERNYRLKPNQAIFENDGNFEMENVDAELYAYWRKSIISFKKETLERIVSVLEKSYNLNVTVSNKSLLKKLITAQVPENNPELLLEAIAEIYNIKLVKHEGKYILK